MMRDLKLGAFVVARVSGAAVGLELDEAQARSSRAPLNRPAARRTSVGWVLMPLLRPRRRPPQGRPRMRRRRSAAPWCFLGHNTTAAPADPDPRTTRLLRCPTPAPYL